MPDPVTLALFAASSLLLIATPGPGLLYLLGRSMDQGRRAGVVSMLGVQAGEAVHIVAAAVGLSALLAASATALDVVRWAGAAYLIVLGIRRWRSASDEEGVAAAGAGDSPRRIFLQGLVVQILNPKVAIFFLAYLPQFVDPAHAAAPQILLLGAVYIAVALVSDTAYVLLGAGLGARLRRSPRAQRILARASAGTYVGLGVLAAVSGHRAEAAAAAARR